MAKRKRKDSQGTPRDATGHAVRAPLAVPGWLPPTVFLVLTLFLFRAFVFSDRMLVGGDTMSLGYVARALYAQALHTLGRVPGWTPNILGGTPFLEALSGGDSLYPPSLFLLLVMEPYRALGWKLVLHIFLAGVFMFGWIRALGGSRPAALLGGVAYMLAPFFVSFVHPGHDGKIFVTALAPLLFWAVERHFARPGPGPFAAMALVVAAVIYTTHFQMAYFLFGAVGLYALFRAVQVARGRGASGDAEGPYGSGGEAAAAASERTRIRAGGLRFATFLLAAALGVGGAAYQFFPAADYVTHYSRRIQTTREAAGESGVAWSSSWSLHPEEVASLVIPEFPGNDANGSAWTRGTYWGRNVFKDNHEYAGLVVLLLAAVSFLGAARPGVRGFFTGLGALALLFALGAHTPVWRIFYEVVPGIRLFRAPSQAIFLFGFGAVTLAALGLDRILELARRGDGGTLARVTRVLWIGAGVMALLALLASSGALTSVWTSVVYRDIDPQRAQRLAALQPFIGRGAWIGFLLAAATSGMVWALTRRKLSAALVVAGLVVLVAVDEVRVDASFIQVMDFHEWSRPDPNIRALLEREREGSGEPYRLLSFVQRGQDVTPAIQGIELAAGHHPNDLARYRELIGMVGSDMPENLFNANVRRILNVRYILWPDLEMGPAPQGTVVSRTQIQGGRTYRTLLADNGLPRARLLARAVVKRDGEDVAYIMSDAHDPATEVVLAEEPPVALDGGPVVGSVTWDERLPDRLRLSVESDRPALLVIADNWFPAWHATVNGEDAPVLRAYHTLRAVPVPAGASTVEMAYHSTLVARSFWLSVVVLVGLLVTGGWALWRGRAGSRPGAPDGPTARVGGRVGEG